ncbi:MAG: hypothetical protein HOV81_10470 [Kofleriaceae bacterium]|nr:hypothetical protein [Kofleriaceae bacterium]
MKLVALVVLLAACSGKDEQVQTPAPALVMRIHDAVLEVDGVGTWKLPAEPTAADFAPTLAAMASHGLPRDGVIVWGAEGTVKRLLVRTLAEAHWEAVFCMPDGSNCPRR